MEARDTLDITYLITVLALNGLGFFIVCVCYSQIYFSLGTETRTRSASSGEMTVAKKMALLVSEIEKLVGILRKKNQMKNEIMLQLS